MKSEGQLKPQRMTLESLMATVNRVDHNARRKCRKCYVVFLVKQAAEYDRCPDCGGESEAYLIA